MTKKLLILPAALALVGTLASCGDNDYEVHQTFFYPQHPGGMIFHADQQMDTIHLYSLDSWTAKTSDSWLGVTPGSLTVGPMTSVSTRLTVTADINRSGVPRRGYLQVQSHDQVGMSVTQYPWLNILCPNARITNPSLTGEVEQARVEYAMRLKPIAADTSVVFRTYSAGATLTSDAPWLTVTAGATAAAGRDTVAISLEDNTTGADRTATLTLTSSGITTPITVVQSGR